MKWGILATGNIASKFARTVNAMEKEGEALYRLAGEKGLFVMGGSPEAFTSEVRLNEYGTDEFSALQLRYPGGRTAHTVQTIGMQIERRAALYFDTATIYLPDFQGAYSMTICPNEGEKRTVECPPDVNGFEYEIREAVRCIKAGESHSDIFVPADSVAVLRLMDEIRKSWGMRFSYE